MSRLFVCIHEPLLFVCVLLPGTSLHTMVLHLKDSSGRLVGVLEDGSRKLGYYAPESGCVSSGCADVWGKKG